MAINKDTVFSEFFFDECGIKVGDNDTILIDCVGTLSEEFEMKTITKSCRGRVKKSRSKPESGTITIAAHIPYETKLALYGMLEVTDGVYGYGTDSMHAECVITAKVLDEDDNVQYRAYPVAVASSKSLSVDDDADEVAMDEIEFAITPDDDEMIVYQALESEITDDIANKWMDNFSTDLFKVAKTSVKATSAKTSA